VALGREWRLLGFALVSACGFNVSVSSDAGLSDTPPVDVVDAAPKQFSAVVSVDRGGVGFLATFPFDDATGFLTPCVEQMVPVSRALLSHPTLGYVYAAANGFGGIAVGCSAITPAMYSVLGAQRPIQTVVLEPTKSTGFFTIDGSSATGVYRFTVSSTGEPTITGPANGPSASGGLALDASAQELYISGANVVWQYKLTGTTLEFPAVGSHSIGVGCADPIAILLSGTKLLEFCGDTPDIRRLARSPFVAETPVAGFGAVDRVVSIGNDRAVAARRSPADLVVVDLTSGSPTWGAGVTVPTRVVAMAPSLAGDVVVTARQVDATNAELTAWKVSGNSLTRIGATTIAGSVTAVTVANPGS